MRFHSFALFRIVVLCSCVCLDPKASAQTAAIELGKYRVHPNRILAKYDTRAAVANANVALAAAGLAVRRQYSLIPGLVVLEPSARLANQSIDDPIAQGDILLAKIKGLRDSGMFEYVEPVYQVRAATVPNDSRFQDGTLWGLKNTGAAGGIVGADIGAEKAWDITTGSTNVIVAIVDSGIRYTHRELAAQMWRNPGEIANNGIDDDRDGLVDDVFGINAVDGTGDPLDDLDHGTHVAGTIGAAANDNHPHVGVAWKVRLMACKFLGSEGFGFTDDAIRCIDYAANHGARVINASWGGGPFQRAMFDAIAAARAKGVIFVAAAGNDGADNDAYPFYPASYELDNVISVAALDRRDRLAWFSNFGLKGVALGAPGVEIFSSTSGNDDEYQVFQGTSMAAPHVSGVAALILAKSPQALLSEVRVRLLSQTVPVADLAGLTITGGRVNAFRALSADPDGELELVVTPPSQTEMLAGSSVRASVIVTDLFPITNASVTATSPQLNNSVVFSNKNPDVAFGGPEYSATLNVPQTGFQFDLKIAASAPGKTNKTQQVQYAIEYPPPNDQFSKAALIPSGGGFVLGTNKLASTELGEPIHARIPSEGKSIWWNWTPEKTSPVIFDTAGSSFDTVLAVYTNSTLATLQAVASANDVGAKKQPYVRFTAMAGVTYHVAVAGSSLDQRGLVRLRVELDGQPDTAGPTVAITSPLSGTVFTDPNFRKVIITGTANDPTPNSSGVKEVLIKVNNAIGGTAFGTTNWISTNILDVGLNTIQILGADFSGNISAPAKLQFYYSPVTARNDLFSFAAELTGSAGEVTADTTGAAKEFGEPLHAGNPGGKSVWWLFRPSQAGTLSLSTTNSNFDTLLAVYTGDKLADLQLVGQNDEAFAGSGWSQVELAVEPNQTYRIAVDGFAAASGKAVLAYSFKTGSNFQLNLQAGPGGKLLSKSGVYPTGTLVSISAEANLNFRFSRWAGDLESFENPLTLRVLRNLNLRAEFLPYLFSDDFESGNYSKVPWELSGNTAWSIQTNVVSAGRFAARSGLISDNQASVLRLSANCWPGKGVFDLRVSCESGFDWLEFYVNGKRLNRWSGDVAWLTYQFDVPGGSNRFEWRYVKDVHGSAGLDAAFLDDVDLPLKLSIRGAAPPSLSLQEEIGGALLVLTGQTNQTFVLQSSANFASWTSILTNRAELGRILLKETPTAPSKFYRAFVP